MRPKKLTVVVYPRLSSLPLEEIPVFFYGFANLEQGSIQMVSRRFGVVGQEKLFQQRNDLVTG